MQVRSVHQSVCYGYVAVHVEHMAAKKVGLKLPETQAHAEILYSPPGVIFRRVSPDQVNLSRRLQTLEAISGCAISCTSRKGHFWMRYFIHKLEKAISGCAISSTS